MSGDTHVRFCESPGVKFPRATHLILVYPDSEKLEEFRARTVRFLKDELRLSINPKNDKIFKADQGLRFLGVVMWPNGRSLNRRNLVRVEKRLSRRNAGSYFGLAAKHGFRKFKNKLVWLIYSLIYPKN